MGTDLTEGSIVKKLFSYALPMMLATALQQVYGMVDMVVMGQFVGGSGLSAVNIGSEVVMLMTAICMGFAMGSQIIIAQHVGAQKREALNGIIGTTFTVLFIGALFATAVSLIFHKQILALLNTPPESLQGATEYMLIASSGLVFVYGYNTVAAILRGMGDATRPLVFIAIASVINIGLDLLFVGALQMDAAGAAWATILAQGISFLISLVYLYHRRVQFGFDFKLRSLRPVGDIVKKMFRLGIPGALQMSAINLSFLFITAKINAYGVYASAAFGVGQRIERLPGIATRGLSQAVSAMVGQNFGAKKFDRIKKTTRISLLANGVVYVVFAALYLLFPETMFRLFTPDQPVVDLARVVLWAMLLAYPFNILMNAYLGVVNGVGNATLGLVLGLLDGVILRVGLAILLGDVAGLGLQGFVMGYSLAALGTAVPAAIYYFTGMWKRRKSLVKDAPAAEAA